MPLPLPNTRQISSRVTSQGRCESGGKYIIERRATSTGSLPIAENFKTLTPALGVSAQENHRSVFWHAERSRRFLVGIEF
jgi:hypothetical protein